MLNINAIRRAAREYAPFEPPQAALSIARGVVVSGPVSDMYSISVINQDGTVGKTYNNVCCFDTLDVGSFVDLVFEKYREHPRILSTGSGSGGGSTTIIAIVSGVQFLSG